MRTSTEVLSAVLAVVTSAVALTGCAAPSEPAAASGPAAPSVQAVPDPHALTGPDTAVLADPDVHPVASPRPALPVVVDSFDGQQVVVEDVSRIVPVDLYGTLGEIVFGLGLGENVVGRDTSTGFPAASHVPEVTVGGHALSAEAVLDLDPTVVLTDTSIGPPEVQQQLRDAGVAVVFFDPSRTMDGVGPQIQQVAAALGVPDAGRQLAERVWHEVAHAQLLVPTGGEPLRVVFLYMRGTAVALMAGPGSGADSLIAELGAVDVGTDIGLSQSFVPITSEALITAQPDVILMMTGGLESVNGVDGLLRVPGVAQTPAGANRRVVDMADTGLLGFGPRTGATLDALARALYRPDGG